jgi:hypothetical protein
MKMNFVVICAFSMLVGAASAQQASTQSDASVSSNTSVSASQNGAGVQSDTNASATSQAGVPTRKQHHPESKAFKHGESQNGPSSGSTGVSGALAVGTTVNSVLSKPLDSRKCKPGDEVVATVSQDVKADGKVVVKKGSKLVGHITEAKTNGEGQANSSLGIIFDHAVLKNGQQVEMRSVVQAIAAAQTNPASSMGDDMGAMGGGSIASTSSASKGSGLLGGVGSTASATTGAATNLGGNVTGAANSTLNSTANVGHGVQGALNSHSTGVLGLNGLSLATQATNATQGSIITSSGKSVHLDSGTQMVLRVTN